MTNENEKTAFAAHLSAILNAAWGMALHLARNSEDAEDLLQEASIKAFAAFDSYERGTNFKAWFFRILINHFLNDRRRLDSRPQTVQVQSEDDGLYDSADGLRPLRRREDPANALLGRLEAEEIRAAFDTLPEEFRLVALLYFFDEFSYEQIARVLGSPIGTIRSRLHRARKLLQKALHDIATEKGIIRESA